MIELYVNGMTCGHCVRAVNSAVDAADPGAKVQVDLGTGRVIVAGQRTSAELISALNEAGYPSMVAGPQAPVAPAKKKGCCCG